MTQVIVDQLRGVERPSLRARAVRQSITQPLKQTEFDALVSFTFNCGEGSLRSSALRRS